MPMAIFFASAHEESSKFSEVQPQSYLEPSIASVVPVKLKLFTPLNPRCSGLE